MTKSVEFFFTKSVAFSSKNGQNLQKMSDMSDLWNFYFYFFFLDMAEQPLSGFVDQRI